jgi:hypothetical protein
MSLCEVHYIFNEESFVPCRSLLYCAHSVILLLGSWVDGWENGFSRLRDGRRLDKNWGWNRLRYLNWLRKLSLLSCCNNACKGFSHWIYQVSWRILWLGRLSSFSEYVR